MRRFLRVFSLLLATAGAVLLVVALWQRLNPIPVGQMHIVKGQAERLIVLDALEMQAPETISPSQAIMAGDAIPLQSARLKRNWIDPSRNYLVTRLPFSVLAREIEVLEAPLARNSLTVTYAGEEHRVNVDVGLEVQIGSESFRVEDIRRWSGLLSDAQGAPMAAVAYREEGNDWSPTLFLRSGSLLQARPNLTVRMTWFGSEEDARKSTETASMPDRPARWAVADGDATHWFTSFLPGTGVELSDGRMVTLVGLSDADGGRPCIILQVRDNGKDTWQRVEANTEAAGIRFESPSSSECAVVIFSWRDGIALTRAFLKSQLVAEKELRTGEEWEPIGFPFCMRLDGTLAAAAPVSAQDSPFSEVILRNPRKRLALRQGELIRYDDFGLRFDQRVTPAMLRYELVAQSDHGAEVVSLGRNESRGVGDWVLRQSAHDSRNPDVVTLLVLRASGWNYAASGTMFIVASITIALLYRRKLPAA